MCDRLDGMVYIRGLDVFCIGMAGKSMKGPVSIGMGGGVHEPSG